MRYLDGDRPTVDQRNLVRTVKLVGFRGREVQRHKGFLNQRTVFCTPPLGRSTNRVAAALITEPSQITPKTGSLFHAIHKLATGGTPLCPQ